ncbi:glycoside hydrolase [Corallococcus sp. CA053C]|uniref:glycoside hydrolase n=1 Tax=Corallococcus sp. CA053C TaxID=2316732 RepID=UPI0011C39C25|nr:glycoside hydrolase [Corallococcus sp. CA053C]
MADGTGIIAAFSPATDGKSLSINVAEKTGTSSLAWQQGWTAFEVNSIAKNPPAVASCNGQTYVFYPSTPADTQYLFYNTWNGTTWSGQTELNVAETATGAGAATFNGQVYVFWQGVQLQVSGAFEPSGSLFYSIMGQSFYWQVGSGPVMSDCPSAVVFNGELYVFYQGTDNDGGLWYTKSSDGSVGSWSSSTQVPNVGMSTSPATAVFTNPSTGQDELYVFHQGGSTDGQLWYNVLDTAGNWAGDKQITSVSMSNVPGATVVDGILYVLYEGGGNDDLFYYISSSDGSTWSTPIWVKGTALSVAPSLAVLNSQLYCMMQGPGNDSQLFYAPISPQSSGGNLSGPYMSAAPYTLSESPGLLTYNNQIDCFFQGASNSGCLWCATYDQNGWAPTVPLLPDGGMTGSPSAVAFNNSLYVFYQKPGNALCYCQSTDGGASWADSGPIPNRALWSSPAATVLGDNLYVFHAAANNNDKLYCSVLNASSGWGSDTEVNITALTSLYGTYSTYTSPAACTYGGNVYVAYTTGNYICMVAYAPSTTEYVIDVGSSPTNIAFVSYDNGSGTQLYCFYQSGTSGDLFYISSSDPLYNQWSAPVEISNLPPTSSPPGIFTEALSVGTACLEMF